MLGTAGYISSNTYPVTLYINYTDWDDNHERHMYTVRQYAPPVSIKPIKVSRYGNCINKDCNKVLTDYEFKEYGCFCDVCGETEREFNRLV